MWLVMWIIGLITGIALVRIWDLIKEGRLNLEWYHWLIGVLWYLSGNFVIGFVVVSFLEGESRAGRMSLFMFGGAFVVISILLFRFVFTNTISSTEKTSSQSV